MAQKGYIQYSKLFFLLLSSSWHRTWVSGEVPALITSLSFGSYQWGRPIPTTLGYKRRFVVSFFREQFLLFLWSGSMFFLKISLIWFYPIRQILYESFHFSSLLFCERFVISRGGFHTSFLFRDRSLLFNVFPPPLAVGIATSFYLSFFQRW